MGKAITALIVLFILWEGAQKWAEIKPIRDANIAERQARRAEFLENQKKSLVPTRPQRQRFDAKAIKVPVIIPLTGNGRIRKLSVEDGAVRIFWVQKSTGKNDGIRRDGIPYLDSRMSEQEMDIDWASIEEADELHVFLPEDTWCQPEPKPGAWVQIDWER